MARNSDTIDNFIAAWSKKDVDLIMSFFTKDAVYTTSRSIPLTSVRR